MPSIPRIALTALLLLTCMLATTTTSAKTFPDHPIRLIVPFSAGGTIDVPVRIIAAALSKASGQQFIVENRSGAGGILGTNEVAHAHPDGYTLLATSSATPISQLLYRNAQFDSLKSFQQIAIYGDTPTVIATNPRHVQAKNLKELVAFAKANPGKLTYGSPGSGTAAHLAAEMLKEALGLDIVHVPYRGATPAITAALGGQVDVIFVGLSSIKPQLLAGKLRTIAITAGTRSSQLPDAPTVNEVVKGYDLTTWLGIAAPAQTPRAVAQRLTVLVRNVMNDADVQKRLRDVGVDPEMKDESETAQQITGDLAVYGPLIRKIHLRLN